MSQLNEEMVLWAVMSDQTPLGAIMDRLKTNSKITDKSFTEKVVITFITQLNQKGVVIVTTGDRDVKLYKKIPWALKKLQSDNAH